MEEEDGTPEGVKARFAKLTEARNAETTRANAAEKKIQTLEAQITEFGGKMEGFAALTTANADLTGKLEARNAEFAQLEGMVSAGFVAADDRDLAAYYHGKSGTDQPLAEWAKTLNAENAPKGLGHLFAPGDPAAPPAPPADPAAPPPPKLPDSNANVKPKPVPQGELTGEQIKSMSSAEYAEWRKTQSWHGKARHQR